MKKKKNNLYLALLSALFTFFQLAGYYISDKYNTTVHYSLRNIWNSSSPAILFLVIGAVEFVVWLVLFFFWFRLLERQPKVSASVPKKQEENHLWMYPLTAAGLFLCWFPYLLASNPGFFNYDVSGQLAQVMYEAVPYVNHHPLVHTLIMGGIINFFYLRTGENLQAGILAFSLFQMLLCSVMFTYFIFFLRKLSSKRWPMVAAFLYYALMPTIALFTMSTTKDVMCFLFLQMGVLLLYDAFANGFSAFCKKKGNLCLLILSLTMSCLMRKNVCYAICLVMVLMLIALRKKGLPIFCSLLCSILLFLLIEKGCMVLLNAANGGAAEAFSVPFQQIARVYSQYGEDGFTPDELEMTLSLFDEDTFRYYNPVFADPIKNRSHFEVVEADKVGWLKYWISVGLKHPDSYIMSFMENTYQAWYPGTSIIVNPVTHQLFYFECYMSLEIDRYSKLPEFFSFIEEISQGELYQKIPVLRLLFSIGAMLWVVLIGLTYGLYTKNQGILWSALLVLALCATNLLGPVSLVRYYLILFYGFPFWFTLLTTARGSKTGKDA